MKVEVDLDMLFALKSKKEVSAYAKELEETLLLVWSDREQYQKKSKKRGK